LSAFEFSEKTTRLMYEQIHQPGFRQANKIQILNSKTDFCVSLNKCSRQDISTLKPCNFETLKSFL
jgi:hypothetical protein